VSEQPLPDPAEPQPIPDEAGDAYVAHATPEPGTPAYRRFVLLRVVPLLAVLLGIALWIVFAR
jgi:hypothetical protein